MIKLAGVSKHYTKDSIGLDDVNLEIQPGEFVSVVGQSGTGKTTLVKLIIAEEKPTHGQIDVGGWDITKIHQRDIPFLRRQIGVIFQDFKLLPQKTVQEKANGEAPQRSILHPGSGRDMAIARHRKQQIMKWNPDRQRSPAFALV